MIVARRVYLYAIAYASLAMLIGGLEGILEVVLESVVEAVFGPFTSVGSDSNVDRLSFSSAVGGIGLVAWAIHWGLAVRAAHGPSGPEERRSGIRKLYLYAVLLVGGLVLMFALRGLLADLLEAAFGLLSRSDLVGGSVIPPLSSLLVLGSFWAYHWRVAGRDRALVPEVGVGATLRRWSTYVLAFVGFLMLSFTAAGLLARLIELAMPSSGVVVADNGRWLAAEVAARSASILTGLLVWGLAWAWSLRLYATSDLPDPERDSILRKVYLYLLLLVAVTWTVWNLGQLLYVLLRSLLIPGEAGALWSAVQRDLGETVASAFIFGLAWAYHARVVKREAANAVELRQQAAVRWIYGYLVAFVGASTLAVGAGGTLATLLDLLARPGASRPEHWWEERLSLFATSIVVGLPVWLIPWRRLQREITGATARRSLVRRIYLFLILGVSVLGLLGSGAFTLYQLLRLVLGERWSGSQTSDLIDAASTAAIAVLLLAYHLRVFQRDAALAASDAPAVPASGSDGAVASPSAAADTVPLLIVRPADATDLEELRRRIEQTVPPGSVVRITTATEDEARSLLERGST